jgi:hypothetical protein
MRRSLFTFLLSSGILICLGWGLALGDTDKTIVDLERSPSALPARYSRPRGAQLYRYDKTELDVATSLTGQSDASQVPSQPQGSTNNPSTPAGRSTPLTSPPIGGR